MSQLGKRAAYRRHTGEPAGSRSGAEGDSDSAEGLAGGLLSALAAGVRVFDLAQPLENGIPCSPRHPGFRMALIRRHGDTVRDDGSSSANELIVTGGHVGTHIDALAHYSVDGYLHGGISVDEAMDGTGPMEGGRFSLHGIEELEPLVAPGMVLDVARAHGVDVLPPAYGIGVADLQAAAELSGGPPRTGEVALVRTGWARYWTDPERYLGQDAGVPGVTEAGAEWLADHGVPATGADTPAYERVVARKDERRLPVHRLLLTERGIHIVEMLDLEAIGDAEVGRFCLVLAPLKINGATGSPARPLAIVDGRW